MVIMRRPEQLSKPTQRDEVHIAAHHHDLLSTPTLFATLVLLLVALYDWPRRWLFAGAPILTYVLLLSAARKYRIVPIIPIWSSLATLHLFYAVAATSWLLYWAYAAICYPIIFVVCLYEFEIVARVVRQQLRWLLRQLHFVNDKIAIFDVPALEIDTTVDGLNHGNYIVSLNQFVKWLGERAEELGVEVYPGFAAAEVLYDKDGSVRGVATNDLGIGRDGKPKDNFERGMGFHARVTMFGEGCHGSLSKQVMKKFDLCSDSQHQTYGLGVKEVWEVDPAKFEKGLIVHSLGYPLPKEAYGGSFMYHFGDNMVTLGLVVALDYENPWLSPYQEFQKMKLHPMFRNVLEGGKCISYGARTIVEGGFQSIPKVAFPGGALIGDSAGFVNVPKIKGTHNAMKSGMLAAEAAWSALSDAQEGTVFLYSYEEALRKSSIWKELKEVRNMRPSFHNPLGLYGGVLYSGLEAYILRGMAPWTLKHKVTDYAATKPADQYPKIEYEKPDGKITFDILTSVSRTGTNHEEDQPVHLQVKDWEAHTDAAYPLYKGLENRFCPAGVYEYVEDDSKPHGVRFQINAQK